MAPPSGRIWQPLNQSNGPTCSPVKPHTLSHSLALAHTHTRTLPPAERELATPTLPTVSKREEERERERQSARIGNSKWRPFPVCRFVALGREATTVGPLERSSGVFLIHKFFSFIRQDGEQRTFPREPRAEKLSPEKDFRWPEQLNGQNAYSWASQTMDGRSNYPPESAAKTE